jgi:DNA-binding helix-hairpin-helix protein with protein kinase domain
MSFYDRQGQAVSLGAELGRGGEGSVYAVPTRRGLVAKVYHQPVDPEKAAKLSTMVRLRADAVLRLAAWPVDTLHDRPNGVVTGLLMPEVKGHKEIHTLYGPRSRLSEFPNATWPFLIHTAANLARAFAAIHDHGHVVGDVNHGNVVVSPQATVMLIDCDSFQVADRGHSYLCEVGVSTHTPPELQGRPFRGIVRTSNHDAFGLAVLIFQLLFMGRHPFSGRYLGPGEMPLEKAIQESRFAYGSRAGERQMKCPPGTLSLCAVSEPIASLFERAFSPQVARAGQRPRPHEWVSALSGLSKGLRQCNNNTGHYFLNGPASCTWCEIEAQTGTVLFIPFLVTGTGPVLTAFDLNSIWSQIAAITSPGPAPALSGSTSLNAQPSQRALAHGRQRRKRKAAAVGFIAVAVTSVIVLQVDGAVAFWLSVGAVVLGLNLAKTGSGELRQEAQKTLQEARTRWHSVEQRWMSEAGDVKFTAKLRELEAKRTQYESLPGLRLQKLQQLEAGVRERQLHMFLDRHKIYGADISGVGPGRKAILQSYGVETAADVTSAAAMAVPGFGPSLTSRLLDWRRSVERRFVFNPLQGVDPSDLAALDRDIGAIRLKTEQELSSGPAQLRQTQQQVIATRTALWPAVQAAVNALAQAEIDLRVL